MSDAVFAHWPNRITALRFIGSAVLFAVLSVWAEKAPNDPDYAAVLCFWLFLVTAATDFLDGYLARRDDHVTAFGRIADPFVDKVLVVGALVLLAVMDWSAVYVPAWIVVVVLAREFLVTGIRGHVEMQGGEFGADWFGKIKMGVQCVAIAAVLAIGALRFLPEALHDLLGPLAHASIWATLITSIGSGYNYVVRAKRMLSA